MSLKEMLRPSPQVTNERERAVSPTTSRSSIPVLERRRMFEPTEPSLNKRGTRGSRGGSFRVKKIKPETDGPTVRIKPPTSPGTLRYRNITHYDIQSMKVITLVTNSHTDTNAKKATGASAAHYETADASDQVANALVASCPAFRNEIGGDEFEPGGSLDKLRGSLSYDKRKRVGVRMNMVLDGAISNEDTHNLHAGNHQTAALFQRQAGIFHPFEFIDYGACYYRNHFYLQDHQNFFGIDETIGPVAISLKREKISEDMNDFFHVPQNNALAAPKYQYRVIVRTSELLTLRSTVLEEAIPSAAKVGTNKSLPPRDVLDYVVQGDFQLSCLKQAKHDKKTQQGLLLIDEQELSNKYKIGVLYCKAGQTTEEDMYNNEHGSTALDEFLGVLGQKVRMKGFNKYKAQLDSKADSTGEYSIYTEFRDTEIMFHVSTLLPFTLGHKQQLLRKRHIGNDIVTIIFQEADSEPFLAKCIRSQFQHIFVVVRVENPGTSYAKYRVAVARSQDIPYFGPEIAEGGIYDKNELFREFLLTKLINACNASLRSEKFSQMAKRTRKQYLLDLVQTSCTSLAIDQIGVSGIVGFMKGRAKKRDHMTQPGSLHLCPGAMTWNVSIIFRNGQPLPFSEDYDSNLDCVLAIAPDLLVFLEATTRDLLVYIPTKDFTGWLQEKTRLNLFYDENYCISIESLEESEEDIKEIVARLYTLAPSLTSSHEATLVTFSRGDNGMLGFTVNEAGVVVKVEGMAKSTGLMVQSRLFQVEDQLLCSTSHKLIEELLTTKQKSSVKAFVVPPPPVVHQWRKPLYYPPLDWTSIWAARPISSGEDDQSKKASGTVSPEPGTEKKSDVSNLNIISDDNRPRSPRSSEKQTDDDQPLYDTLKPKSATVKQHKSECARIRAPNASVRQSVLNFANEIMEKGLERSSSRTPEPVDHTIEAFTSLNSIHISWSKNPPRNHAHMALSLKSRHDRAGSEPSNYKTTLMQDSAPGTPVHVSDMTKFFSEISSPSQKLSRTSVASQSLPHSPIEVAPKQPIGSSVAVVNNHNKRSGSEVAEWANSKDKTKRPLSWEPGAFTSFNQSSEGNKDETQDDSAFENSSASPRTFSRESAVRLPFRRKLGSQDLISHDTDKVTSDKAPTNSGIADPMQPSSNNFSPTSTPVETKSKLKPPSNTVSVRERTQKWEERGGSSAQAHLATLPRPLKKKSLDPSMLTSSTSASVVAQKPASSVPVSKPSLRSSPSKNLTLDQTGSDSSEQMTAAPTKNIEVGAGEETQRGDCSTPLIRSSGGDGGHLSKSLPVPIGKSRGQTLLPTRTMIPAAMQRPALQHPTLQQENKIAPVVSNGKVLSKAVSKDTDADDKSTSPSSRLPVTRLGVPRLMNILHQDRVDDASRNSHIRQQSGDSSHSFGSNENKNLTGQLLPMEDNGDNSDHKKKVEQWMEQSSEPELTIHDCVRSEGPPFASPTFTDTSLSFSGLSECSPEHVESLMQRIAELQTKLEVAVEDNDELKKQLRRLEKRLEEKESAGKKTASDASERTLLI